MKFFGILTTALLSATAVFAIPAGDLEARNKFVHCPNDSKVVGSQTYTTYCRSVAIPNPLAIVQLAAPAKSFKACLQQCSSFSDSGTCCRVANFNRVLKLCTLYGAPIAGPLQTKLSIRDIVGMTSKDSC